MLLATGETAMPLQGYVMGLRGLALFGMNQYAISGFGICVVMSDDYALHAVLACIPSRALDKLMIFRLKIAASPTTSVLSIKHNTTGSASK